MEERISKQNTNGASNTNHSISETRTKKKKKGKTNGGNTANNKKGWRMKKSDLDDLVRGIGLEPVAVQKSTPSEKETKAATALKNTIPNSLDEKKQQQQQSNGKKNDITVDPFATILQQSQQQQQSTTPSIISLQTQLNYAQNGHTVLRSFLPPTLIRQLRSELVPYASSRELSAWRQKVEVQLSDSCSDEYYRTHAREIAEGLESVEDCADVLEGLGVVDGGGGGLPFLQHFNAWRAHHLNDDADADDADADDTNATTGATDTTANILLPTVTTLCLSPHLATAASLLLRTPTVRLYQDSLFHKRASKDGWTPWHSDARMAPFDTSKMITFWIPLQKVPCVEEGGTGLVFANGSHCDFALPYWNGGGEGGDGGGGEYDRLERRYGTGEHHMPLAVGDVTVHNGWTLHCADAAPPECAEDRYAFSITYVDGRAEVREDVLPGAKNGSTTTATTTATATGGLPKGDREDVWSFRSWVEEVEPRTEFRHPLVPIVWPPKERDVENK